MKGLIRLLYKGFQYGWVILTCWISTYLFRFLLWINDVDYGKNIMAKRVVPKLIINRLARKICIADHVSFNSYGAHSWNCKCKIIVRPYASLLIGHNTGLNGVMIYVSKSVTIGNNVKIGGGTRIYDTNFHALNYKLRRDSHTDEGNASALPIDIGDDVFIGAGCFIGKGVSIGARSIIAAGSVVVKDIPEDSIAGGNPCKVIKFFF